MSLNFSQDNIGITLEAKAWTPAEQFEHKLKITPHKEKIAPKIEKKSPKEETRPPHIEKCPRKGENSHVIFF